MPATTRRGSKIWDLNGRVMAQSQPFFDSATAETTLVPAVSKNPTVFMHDALNRVTAATTADGAMTQTVYGALLPSPEDPGDPIPGYNGQLSLERITDANENTTRIYRDGAGRILFNMDAQNNVTAYGYDPLNNLSAVTDANGNVTTGAYDSLSRLASLSSPDTGRTDWRYALTGLLQEKQTANLRAKSQLIKYGYMTNRLSTITYPMMPVVTYAYGMSTQAGDTNGNIAGRIASVTMEGGTELRQYDAFGNVSQTVTKLNHINNTSGFPSPTVTMKYAYDWLGRTETMTFPKVFTDGTWNIATGDGEVITYTYDAGGSLKQITGKLTPTSTAENYLSGIGYDEFGTRANLVSGNGITTAYTYEPAQHRLSTVTASGKVQSGATVQFLNVTYGYDPVGNVLTVNNNIANSAIQPNSATVGVGPLSITNTYDVDNRLSSSSGMYRGHSTSGQAYSTMFLYNGIDNITSKSQVDNSLTFAAGASGLSNPTFGTAIPGTSYTLHYSYTTGKVHQPGTIFDINSTGTQSTRTENFDLDGNNTGDSVPASNTRVLAWDETDRLKSVTLNGGVQARYQYNPDGERTQKQDAVAGTTTFYFNQFLVINGSRQMTKSLFAGETRIASKTESSVLTGMSVVRSFYHPDNVGSTSYISNAAQTLVQHERYFPTGERWSSPEETVTTGVTPTNIRRDYLFTGKELDRDTGFYYFGARYLDPRTSNWMSPDPDLPRYMRGEVNGGVFMPGNLGLYTYTLNNPVVLKDPNGRNWFNVGGNYEWHAGSTYRGMKSSNTNFVEFQKTGTNAYGASTGTLRLFDQNKVIAEGQAFSGGVDPATGQSHGDIPAGTYTLNLSQRSDASSLSQTKAVDGSNDLRELIPDYGYQTIASPEDFEGGFDFRYEWGSIRARLTPDAKETGRAFRGNYIHGKEKKEDWTHGCICNRREDVLKALGDQPVEKKVPVQVKPAPSKP